MSEKSSSVKSSSVKSSSAKSSPVKSSSVASSSAGLLAWAGVGVLTLSAMLAAALEALLVPIYVGSVVVPIAVVFALASNVALPMLARALVPRATALLLPFLGWLLVIVVFGIVARPEGDVILPGGSGAVHYVSYGVMFGGALAGVITLVAGTPPRPPISR